MRRGQARNTDYYSISYSYLHTVIERVRKRFPAEDCDKMEQMLSVIILRHRLRRRS